MKIKTGGRNYGKLAAIKEKYGEIKRPAKPDKLLGRNLDVTWLIDPSVLWQALNEGNNVKD